MKKIFYVLLCSVAIFGFSLTASAMELPEDLPALPTKNKSDLDYTIFSYVYYLVDDVYCNVFYGGFNPNTVTIKPINETSISITGPGGGIAREIYELKNGSWVRLSNGSSASYSINLVNPRYTSIDILNEDGTAFFPVPPVVEEPETEKTLTQMVAELMTVEAPKILKSLVGVMKILLICGTGFLAWFVVLAIFGKVLRLFQVK